MFDLERDELITLAKAAAFVPARRGRKTASDTIRRWVLRGMRGVKLEALRTPSGWLTTKAAVLQFLERLAEADRHAKRDITVDLKAAEQRQTWADDVLDRAGIGKRRT